jgi:hypothetical protein
MRKFGITEQTQGSQGVQLPAPIKLNTPNPMFKTGYEFPLCKLVAVSFNPEKKIKRGGVETLVYALEFRFKDAKDRQYTHIEWPLDPTSKNAEKEPEWQDQRIKHIWEETIGSEKLPKEGLGTGAKTESEYFKLIADGFNSIKISVLNPKYVPNETPKEGQEPISQTVDRVAYGQTFVYLKLTYNKTNLQLPLFPNFIQRGVINGAQVPVEKLMIDLKYDNVEPSISTSNTPSAAAGLSTGLDATFGGANFDGDLPEFLQ